MDYAEIEAFCLALPGATADVKWQVDRVFSVGGKMFCVFCLDRSVSTGVSLKADPARFLELTDQPGIAPAPYLARHHWVRLEHPGVVADETFAALLTDSYRLVRAKLPKKLRDSLPAQP
ncbi:MmcQ/YjbR family DNA-binding protein [Chitinimonas koreensis]|uniref:MmcQ/YjbR family DNA-binding protein n=1 Tax=Chitinimonas koreensis TaxID=356302 RepID=UPI000422373C|nr:MmcQ/YjbR family DNA-binding protein [Chitinimonas koreensis]QNM96469.1 MmcQ/YjbR family DNA-binding protein [Chitinimonas koreensis]